MANRNELLNDPQAAMRAVQNGLQSKVWTCMPAVVTKVNAEAMTIEAQITIQGVVTNEDGSKEFVNLPPLGDVPICFPRAGGFSITFPIAVGNEVLIIFASRCIDAWWQSGGIQQPMEFRMHDLSDGFAILAPTSQPNVLSSISPDGIQIRKDDGSTYISVDFTNVITIKALDVNIIGNLTVSGDVTASGEVTAMSESLPVGLSTHVHPGVQSGGSSTGTGVG